MSTTQTRHRCARCRRRAAKGKSGWAHASRSPFAVVCAQCAWESPGDIHRVLHPECVHQWHDFWDHETLSGPLDAILAVASGQPAPLSALMSVEIGPPATPRVLLESRHCTAQCMLALAPDSSCDCPCVGEFHGLLTDAPWPDDSAPTQPEGADQ